MLPRNAKSLSETKANGWVAFGKREAARGPLSEKKVADLSKTAGAKACLRPTLNPIPPCASRLDFTGPAQTGMTTGICSTANG